MFAILKAVAFLLLFTCVQNQLKDEFSCIANLNLTIDSGCCGLPYCCTSATDYCCCEQNCFKHGDCCLDVWKLGCQGEPEISISKYTCDVVYGRPMEGCCTGDDCRGAYGPNQPCYCDQECYHHNDCCNDIMDIGCKCDFKCEDYFGNNTSTIGGCCEGSDSCSTSCCSCDHDCYSRGDCCMDIEEWGCLEVPVTPEPIYCPYNETVLPNDGDYSVIWNTTQAGLLVSKPCPASQEGSILRNCSDEGEWGAQEVDCQTEGLSNTKDMLENADDLTAEEKVIVTANVSDFAVRATSDRNFHTKPSEVSELVTIVSTAIDLLQTTVGEIDPDSAYLNTEYLDVFSNLLRDEYLGTFQAIGNSSNGSSNDLMSAYDRYSDYVGMFEVHYTTQLETIKKENIVFNSRVLTATDRSNVVFPQEDDLVDSDVIDNDTFPFVYYDKTDLDNFAKTGKVAIVNSLIRNVEKILPKDFKDSATQFGSIVLNSVVVSDEQSGRLPGVLNFTTKQFYRKTPTNLRCVYWDGTENDGIGAWSTDGIEEIDNTTSVDGNYTRGSITCLIEHQTPFSVLVDVHGIEYNPTEQYALDIVGYIGLSISIVCLSLTILMLILLGKQLVLSTQYFIHFNLSIALLAGYIIFLLFIDERIINVTNSKIGCAIVAAFLQYFFTAAFAWMLCEGIMLFLLLVIVFATISKRWYLFLLIGWGLPLIPVVVSAGLIYDHYGSPGRHCWIDVNESKSAIWAFVVPMLIIIIVNTFFFIMSIRALILYHRKKLEEKKENKAGFQIFKKMIVSTIILLPLMGLTWVIGLLAVDENTTVFAWLFVVMNSLQGLFIFVFNIVRNDKIKENFMKKCCPKKLRMKKSTSSHFSSSNVKKSESFSYSRATAPSRLSQQFLMSSRSDPADYKGKEDPIYDNENASSGEDSFAADVEMN